MLILYILAGLSLAACFLIYCLAVVGREIDEDRK